VLQSKLLSFYPFYALTNTPFKLYRYTKVGPSMSAALQIPDAAYFK
jgi:hypothetical protein